VSAFFVGASNDISDERVPRLYSGVVGSNRLSFSVLLLYRKLTG
jgi:hypothetical protein